MQTQLFLNKQSILNANQELFAYHLSLEVIKDLNLSEQAWEPVMEEFLIVLQNMMEWPA